MKAIVNDPPPLGQLPPERDPHRIAPVIRSLHSLPELSASARQMLRWRIRNTLRPRASWRAKLLRPAFALGCVFLGGGAVGAALHRALSSPRPFVQSHRSDPEGGVRRPRWRGPFMHGSGRSDSESRVAAQPEALPPVESKTSRESEPKAQPDDPPVDTLLPVPVMDPVPRHRVALATPRSPLPGDRGQRASSEDHLPSPTPALDPAPFVPTAAPPTAAPPAAALPTAAPPAAVPSVSARVAPSPTTISSPIPPLPAEHQLLSNALRMLQARQPARALAELDRHQLRFPDGDLGPEAMELRAEALLDLGRTDGALRALDALLQQSTPRSIEHHVLRGELCAGRQLFREAVDDFDFVLRHAAALTSKGRRAEDDLVERALWGRAAARTHLGDIDVARADLTTYLRQYPRGRFAGDAAHALGSLP